MIVSVRRALIVGIVSSVASFFACTEKKAEEPVVPQSASEEIPAAPAAPEAPTAPEAPVTLDDAAPGKKPAKSKKKAAKKANKADKK